MSGNFSSVVESDQTGNDVDEQYGSSSFVMKTDV
jgi:hypothetical protein